MNGQPTAQNTRETGANGDLPGFRNFANDEHVADLARVWNVEPDAIPHAGPPTHAMQIFRYAEEGSIRFLWVAGTNPAVSLPELARIRAILGQERLFLVVQDIFLTETAALADVVLPAATWGEKTGTFTNVDRTVHLSGKAVEPPGDARPDLDIFLDYARRLDLKDKNGGPLVHWTDAESAFEAWKACSAGRPCDYTGLTYAMLRGPSGIQWPVNAANPHGTERLYADGFPWAAPDMCESYGKDTVTGAPSEPAEYKATNPDGKALLKGAPFARRTRSRARTSRTSWRPAGRCTSSTPAPRPAGHRSSTVPHRRSGSRCPRPTPSRRDCGKATCCRSPHRGLPCVPDCGSAASATGSCSCRFTTATGTTQTPPRVPPTSSRSPTGTR